MHQQTSYRLENYSAEEGFNGLVFPNSEDRIKRHTEVNFDRENPSGIAGLHGELMLHTGQQEALVHQVTPTILPLVILAYHEI